MLTVSDADQGQAKFVVGAGVASNGALGNLSIAENGPGATTSTTARCSTWAWVRPVSRTSPCSRWTAPRTP
ncbi:VCBS domain-containing protein [Aeromonas salmonicida]|uniref:VCBS domain-containing protein n=1 Tax=Aeromonas salmonicida TaxID=645 RepID=UPI003B97F1C5